MSEDELHQLELLLNKLRRTLKGEPRAMLDRIDELELPIKTARKRAAAKRAA